MLAELKMYKYNLCPGTASIYVRMLLLRHLIAVTKHYDHLAWTTNTDNGKTYRQANNITSYNASKRAKRAMSDARCYAKQR